MKEPKPTNPEHISAEVDEQVLIDYLRENPDFFSRYSELLSELAIPHEANGAVSLIERQVHVLRQQQINSQNRLQDLVETARDNERLSERLHRVSLEAIAIDDLDGALTTLPDLVRESFVIDYLGMRVESPVSPEQPREELVDPRDETYRDVRIRIAHGRAVCDDRLAPAAIEYLFGASAIDHVLSVALVPLGRHPIGVLALGSKDASRFKPDMGTWYLDRIGELLGAVLRRLIP